MSEEGTRVGRRGRPARPPVGAEAVFVDFARWLIDVMEMIPAITRGEIARRIPSPASATGYVAVSTVSEWLSGEHSPDDRIVQAVVDARSAFLGATEKLELARNAADWRVRAHEATKRKQIETVQVTDQVPIYRPTRAGQPWADELNRQLRQERIARAAAEQRADNADSHYRWLIGRIRDLEHELGGAISDRDRARADLTAVLLEGFELQAGLDRRGLRIAAHGAPASRSAATSDEVRQAEERYVLLLTECEELERRKVDLEEQSNQARERALSEFNEQVRVKAELQADIAAEESNLAATRAQLEQINQSIAAARLELDRLGASLDPAIPLPHNAPAHHGRLASADLEPVFQRLRRESHDYMDGS